MAAFEFGPLLSSLTLLFTVFKLGSAAIDCFKCVSRDFDNPACNDPFHNNFTRDIIESPCMGGRKDRNGLFPATACIKLTGTYEDESGRSRHITVRGCALDSGTLTTDTELIRMSHCGSFYFDGNYMKGCLQSCDDGDACNHSHLAARTHGASSAIAAVATLLYNTPFHYYNTYS